MKKNTLLLLAGAAILYYLMMKKKAAVKLPEVTASNAGMLPNVEEIRSQTVNFEQLAPSPATIMDMPNVMQPMSYQGCSCPGQGGGRLGDLPVVC